MAEGETGETTTGEQQTGEAPAGEVAKPKGPAEEIDWKAAARFHEKEAKDAAKAAKAAAAELDKIEREKMTDQEKAVAEALDAGRAEGLKAGSTKLAAAELKAALVGRSVDAEALLEGVDLSKFVDAAGEPDADAIVAWVERVAPMAAEPDPLTQQFPNLGQGNVTDKAAADRAAALNGDPLLAALKGKVGAR